MDIETLIVAVIVLGAASVLLRNATKRGDRSTGPGGTACGGGCSGCGPDRPAPKGRLPVIVPAIAMLLLAPEARAADTIETFDAGAMDLELYVALEGVDPTHQDITPSTELVIGVGLAERLSLCFVGSMEANQRFEEPAGGIGIALFGTPLETEHVDLDLVIGVGVGGPELNELSVAPAFELNLDVTPDLGTAGFYLRAGPELTGEFAPVGAAPPAPSVALVLNPGGYVTFAKRHQLLLEYDMSFAAPADGGVDVGGVALGYNVVLAEPFELITALAVDLPMPGEPVQVGFSVGFVAGIPPIGG